MVSSTPSRLNRERARDRDGEGEAEPETDVPGAWQKRFSVNKIRKQVSSESTFIRQENKDKNVFKDVL